MVSDWVKNIVLISVVLFCVPGCVSQKIQENTNAGVTIYRSTVITMAADGRRSSAVAVRGDQIVGVDTPEALAGQFESSNLTYDDRFINKVLMPGFIDNHLHPAMAAVLLPMHFITPFDWNLTDRSVKGVLGRDEYLKKLVQTESSLPDGEWLFTWGYHPYFHGELSKSDLDTISTERPIVVWHRSFHEIYVNSAGLSKMNIDAEQAASHPHVRLEQGYFFETGIIFALAGFAEQILMPEQLAYGMSLVRDTIHKGGITTIADMAFGLFNAQLEWPVMKQVLDSDLASFRTLLVPAAPVFGERAGDQASLEIINALTDRNSDKLFFDKQIKLFADGAFYSQLMQMNAPGFLDGHHGEWIMQPDDLEFAARSFWREGYQLHVHTNGDHGVDVVLDVLERLQQETPRQDHRFTLHHLGYSTDEQSRRMAKLGALVSANPYYLYTLGDKYSEIGLGPERASGIFRGASLTKAGVPLSLHSDFTMAPAAPLTLAWVAANRQTASGKVMKPELKLSLDEALRAITIEAAFAIQMEDSIGSIEVGKKADFTVLESDPYARDTNALKDIKIWGTIFEGTAHPLPQD